VVAVAAIAVVAIVLTTGNRSSSHGGIASSTTTTTAPLTAAQSQLLGLVASYKCTPEDASVGIAYVFCNPASSVINTLSFWLFADQPSLDRAMAATYGAFQPCPGQTQPGPQDWHRASDPQHSAGKVGCYLNQRTSYYTVQWSVDSEMLLGEATTAFGGFDSPYQWWEAGNQ
jgi:hypothetical protein